MNNEQGYGIYARLDGRAGGTQPSSLWDKVTAFLSQLVPGTGAKFTTALIAVVALIVLLRLDNPFSRAILEFAARHLLPAAKKKGPVGMIARALLRLFRLIAGKKQFDRFFTERTFTQMRDSARREVDDDIGVYKGAA